MFAQKSPRSAIGAMISVDWIFLLASFQRAAASRRNQRSLCVFLNVSQTFRISYSSIFFLMAIYGISIMTLAFFLRSFKNYNTTDRLTLGCRHHKFTAQYVTSARSVSERRENKSFMFVLLLLKLLFSRVNFSC
jgi:hypothetical protein